MDKLSDRIVIPATVAGEVRRLAHGIAQEAVKFSVGAFRKAAQIPERGSGLGRAHHLQTRAAVLALVNQYEADLLEKALARCRRVLDFVDAHVLAPLEPSEQQRILDRRWVMTAGWHRPAPAAFAALAVVVRDADCADVALTFCGPTFLEAIRAYILRKAPLSHLMRREAPHATLRKPR